MTPEYAIQSLFADKNDIFPVTQYVPDPGLHAVPCDLSEEGLNRKVCIRLPVLLMCSQIFIIFRHRVRINRDS